LFRFRVEQQEMEEMELMMQLSELGFDSHRIQAAIKATKSESLDACLDWLQRQQHADFSQDDPSTKVESVDEDEASSSGTRAKIDASAGHHQPKAIEENAIEEKEKREEDGKNIEDKGAVEEGGQQRMETVRQRMAEKRRSEEAAQEQAERQRELQRRQEGKDIVGLRRQRDDQARMKMIEEQRQEEAFRRERILAMIAQDRRNQEEAQSSLTKLSEQEKLKEEESVSVGDDNGARGGGGKKKDNSQIRIQIRGVPLHGNVTMTFSRAAVFDDVVAEVEQRFPGTLLRYRLIVALPPQEFGPGDGNRSLVDLGLAPSCVLTLALRK
jgi:hypothetical protein